MPFHNEKNVSVIYLDLMPNFWPSKRLLINVKERYLLYKNLTTDDRNERIIKQTPDILIPLSDTETQSLLDAFNEVKHVNGEYIAIPDGSVNYLSAVVGDNDTLIVMPDYETDGLLRLMKQLSDIIAKKSLSKEVQQELIRLGLKKKELWNID